MQPRERERVQLRKMVNEGVPSRLLLGGDGDGGQSGDKVAAGGGGPCPLGELCKLRRPRPKPEPSDADAPPPDAKPPPVVWSNSPSTRPQFPSA